LIASAIASRTRRVREQGVAHVVAEEEYDSALYGCSTKTLCRPGPQAGCAVDQHDQSTALNHQRLGHDVLVGEGLGDDLSNVRLALK